MSPEVLHKLLAIMATVGLGWLAARRGWLGRLRGSTGAGGDAPDIAQVLGHLAFHLFVPALLFRTLVRQDLAALPWRFLAAYFVPAILFILAVYAWQRWRPRPGGAPAEAATRAITAGYGNAAQLGIPMAAALFGEQGLALHIALVSVHGLILLTLLTVLVEADVARADPAASRRDALKSTVRNAIVHPVVLPVLAGLAWNLTGWGLHPAVDEALAGLASGVVPLCLVLIGVSLATYGVRGGFGAAAGLSVLKMLVLPALVLAVAHGLFGLDGVPLAVLVMMAALPVGNNALIFAQRYGVLQAETTVALVLSTAAFAGAAALWLAVLARVATGAAG